MAKRGTLLDFNFKCTKQRERDREENLSNESENISDAELVIREHDAAVSDDSEIVKTSATPNLNLWGKKQNFHQNRQLNRRNGNSNPSGSKHGLG